MNSDTPATVVQYTKKVFKKGRKLFWEWSLIHESEFQCVCFKRKKEIL
uniref:Predicted protein n=1 Tax=Hordeum vulgare subsp. vulgare TaxID=112509 RepID=F2E293_HORVV|nr:predicted protein [Hordeum vulgare subsp. vulgare]